MSCVIKFDGKEFAFEKDLIAYLESKAVLFDALEDYVCHSGGALRPKNKNKEGEFTRTLREKSADIVFEKVGITYGVITKTHSFKGHSHGGSLPIEYTEEQLREADPHLLKAAISLNRDFPPEFDNEDTNEYVTKLLRRNYFQVINSEAIFAVGTISNLNVNGGTGWAVAMARNMLKSVYVFEQNENIWYYWDYKTNKFKKFNGIPLLTKSFAGIGTRQLNDNGVKAIEALYYNTANTKVQGQLNLDFGKDTIEDSTKSADAIRYTHGILSDLELKQISNIGAGILYNLLSSKEFNPFIDENELKDAFVTSFLDYSKQFATTLSKGKQEIFDLVVNNILVEDSIIWQYIKANLEYKYHYKIKSTTNDSDTLQEFEDGVTKDTTTFEDGDLIQHSKEFDDSKIFSKTPLAGALDVQVVINSLVRRKFDNNGNVIPDTDNFLGIPEFIDYKSVFPRLSEDLISTNFEDFNNRLIDLGKRFPTITPLVELLTNDENLLKRFYSVFNLQKPESIIVLLDGTPNDATVNAKTKIQNFESFTGNFISTIWVNNLQNIFERGSLWESDIAFIQKEKEELENLFLLNKIKKHELAERLSKLYSILGITVDKNILLNKFFYKMPTSEEFLSQYTGFINEIIKNYNTQETFERRGDLKRFADLIASATLEGGSTAFYNVKGDLRNSTIPSSFISNWFTLFKNKEFNELFGNMANLRSVMNINWFNELGVVQKVTKEDGTTEFIVSEEMLNNFGYFHYGGIKNEKTRKALEYQDFHFDSFKLGELLLFLKEKKVLKENTFAAFLSNVPSDGSNIFGFKVPIKSLTIHDYLAFKNKDIQAIKNSPIFKLILNTVYKEINDATVAHEFLKDYMKVINDEKGNPLTILTELPKGAYENYHYKTKKVNGKTVYTLGNVFKLNNLKVEVNDAFVGVNDIFDKEYILRSDLVTQQGKPTLLTQQLVNRVAELASMVVNENLKYYNKNKDNIKKAAGIEEDGTYEMAITEFILNRYLFDVEASHFWAGSLAFYSNNQNYFKRGKQLWAFGEGYIEGGFLSLTASSIVKASTVFEGMNIDTTDGITLLTAKAFRHRQEASGRLKKLNVKVPQKNFYYDFYYDDHSKTLVPLQIKNSEMLLDKEVFKNTILADLITFLEQIEEEQGMPVQLNFDSTIKVGNAISTSITDENGNIVLDDRLKTVLLERAQVLKYENLRRQLDFPAHTQNSSIKQSIQFTRSALVNLNDNAIYEYGDVRKKGKELRKFIFDLRKSNIEKSGTLLTEQFLNNGEVSAEAFSEYLIDKARFMGLSENVIQTMMLNEFNDFNIDLSFSNDAKAKEYINSLYTKKVIRQLLPGFHVAQLPNLGIQKIGELTQTDKKAIHWHPSKKDNEGLQPPRFLSSGTIEAEIVLPIYYSSFVKKDGTIDWKNIDEKALTLLGYRIPTEGRNSGFVFKVVGFFPKGYEAGAIIPDEWVLFTGSDFDIDSIYVAKYNVDENNKTIKFLDKDVPLRERATAYVDREVLTAFSDKELESFRLKIGSLNRNIQIVNTNLKETRKSYKEFHAIFSSILGIKSTNESVFKLFKHVRNLKEDLLSKQKTVEFAMLNNSKESRVVALQQSLDEVVESIVNIDIILKDFREFTKNKIEIKELKQVEEELTKEIKATKEAVVDAFLANNPDFDEWNIEDQNSTKAKQNALLDSYIAIWKNKYHQKEIQTISDFKSVQDAVDFVNSIKFGTNKKDYHPFYNISRLEMTNILMAGRDTKGILVNSDTLNMLANSIKGFIFKDSIPIKLTKEQVEEIGKDKLVKFFKDAFDPVTNVIHYNRMADNLKGTGVNVLGEYIVSNAAKLTSNSLDIAKKPFTPNTNKENITIVKLLASFGHFDYNFGFLLLENPIIVIYNNIKESVENGVFTTTLDPFTSVLTEAYHAIHSLKHTIEGKDYVRNSVSYKKLTKNDFIINDFVPSNADLIKAIKQKKNPSNMQESIDRLIIAYNTLLYYNKLEQQASLIEDLIVALSFDRMTIGSDFFQTRSTLERIQKIEKSKKVFTNKGESLMSSFYPTFFEKEQESIYPPMETTAIYANLSVLSNFSKFFATESPSVIAAASVLNKDNLKREFQSYVLNYLLARNPFFGNLKEGKTGIDATRRVLGIGVSHNYLNIFKANKATLEIFKNLPVANKLNLVKTQLADINNPKHALLFALEYNKNYRTKYDYIKVLDYQDQSVVTNSFLYLLNSSNPYFRDLAYDLIRYEYLVHGLKFGVNLFKFIPQEVFYTYNQNPETNLEVASILKDFKENDDFTDHLAFQELAVDFLRTKHNDASIIPRFEEEVLLPFLLDVQHKNDIYREVPDVYLVDAESYKFLNRKLKSPIISIVKYDENDNLTSVLYRSKKINKIDSVGNTYLYSVLYYPVSKLERFEHGEQSYLDSNNKGAYSFNSAFFETIENFIFPTDEQGNIDNDSTPTIFFDALETSTLINTPNGNIYTPLDVSARLLINKQLENYFNDGLKEQVTTLAAFTLQAARRNINQLTDYELITAAYHLIRKAPSLVQRLNGLRPESIPRDELIDFVNDAINDPALDIDFNIETVNPIKVVSDFTQDELFHTLQSLFVYRMHMENYYKTRLEHFEALMESENLLNNPREYSAYVNTMYNLQQFIKNQEKYGEFKDYMAKRDSEDPVNNLDPDQIKLNKFILFAREKDLNVTKLRNKFETLKTKVTIAKIIEVSDNPDLAASENKETLVKEWLNSVIDTGGINAQFDSVFYINDPYIQAELKFLKSQKGNQLKTKLILQRRWDEALQEFKDKGLTDYSELAKSNGKWNIPLINTRYPKFKLFLDSIKVYASPHLTESQKRFLNNNYIFAYPKDFRNFWTKVAEDGLGLYDLIPESDFSHRDAYGTVVRDITFRGLTKLEKREEIFYSRTSEQTQEDFEYITLVNAYESTGLIFNDLIEIDNYNKKVRAFNKKLKYDTHYQNVSLDLNNIIPAFINDLTDAINKQEQKLQLITLINDIKEKQLIKSKDALESIRTITNNVTKIFNNNLKARFLLNRRQASMKIPATNSNLVKQLNWYLHNHFYGDSNQSSVGWTKTGRVIRRYTTLLGLGLNPYSSVNNLLYGTFVSNLEAISGGDFTKNEWRKGYASWVGSLYSSMVENPHSSRSSSLQSALIKFSNVLFHQLAQPDFDHSKIKSRKRASLKNLLKNAPFVGQQAGEHFLQNSMLFTMMHALRIVDGKVVSFREYLTQELKPVIGTNDEKLQIIKENKEIRKTAREHFVTYKTVYEHFSLDSEGYLDIDAALTDRELALFLRRVIMKNHKLHGVYNKEDLGLINAVEHGRMIMLFRKWFKPGIDKRFGHMFGKYGEFNEFTRDKDVGTYTSFYNYIFNLKLHEKSKGVKRYDNYLEALAAINLRGRLINLVNNMRIFKLRHFGLRFKSLPLEEKQRVIQGFKEHLYFLISRVFSIMLSRLDEDDEKLKRSRTYVYINTLFRRLSLEIGLYNPVILVKEGRQILKNPSAGIGATEGILDILIDLASLAAYELGATSKYSPYFKTGPHKGEYKLWVDFQKAIPIYNKYYKLQYGPAFKRHYGF